MRIVTRTAAAVAVTGAIFAVGMTTTEAAQAAPANTHSTATNVVRPAGVWQPTVEYRTYDECVTAGIAGKNDGRWSAYSCDYVGGGGWDWPWALDVFVE